MSGLSIFRDPPHNLQQWTLKTRIRHSKVLQHAFNAQTITKVLRDAVDWFHCSAHSGVWGMLLYRWCCGFSVGFLVRPICFSPDDLAPFSDGDLCNIANMTILSCVDFDITRQCKIVWTVLAMSYCENLQRLSNCSEWHYLDLWVLRTLSASVDMATYIIHNLQPLGKKKKSKTEKTLLRCFLEDTESSLESFFCYWNVISHTSAP